MTEDVEAPDTGADGPAALNRTSSLVTVLTDTRSRFKDSGVEVRQYLSTQLDALWYARKLSQDQYSAARHVTALWRGAALTPTVTSRYSEWVSGARGQWMVTDDGTDEAQPFREMLEQIPTGPAQALMNLLTGTFCLSSMPQLLEALDRVSFIMEWSEED